MKSFARRWLGGANANAPPSAGGIVAVLESPTPTGPPASGHTLLVSGWAIADAGLSRVRIGCDGGPAHDAELGAMRPDVALAYPAVIGAARSGFFGLIDLDALAPGKHHLKLAAVAADGRELTIESPFELLSANAAYRAWQAHSAGRPAAARGQETHQRKVSISAVITVASPAQAAALWQTWRSIDVQSLAAEDVHLLWLFEGTPVVTDVSRTLGQALSRARGEFVALLEAGDTLVPEALEAVSRSVALHPGTALLYSDHEAGPAGQRLPVFKPAWSPLLFARSNYIAHPWFARREALLEAFQEHGDPRLDEQAAIGRLADGAAIVTHLPAVLLSRGGPAPVSTVPVALTRPLASARISVVIPTRLTDRALFTRCMETLLQAGGSGIDLEVLVLVNNVASPEEAAAFLSRWPVRALYSEAAFNWSALNNAGAAEATGGLLLFLNDDVHADGPGWLGAMVRLIGEPGVGAVGAVLRYPGGRIQHAGIFVHGGAGVPRCRHMFRFCRGDEPEVSPLLAHDREQSAVTGACLLVPRGVFAEVGGFDEKLALVFNDVDFCLRLGERGYASVVCAGAELFHHEGLSRGGMAEAEDERRFSERWRGNLPSTDPFYNPQLRRDADDWSIDPTAASVATPRHQPGRLLNESAMSTDLAWKRWGEQDPYYGVITDPKYRSDNLTDEAREHFFASGRSHARHVLAICAKRVLRRDFHPARMLDFGCGVGRLLVSFAENVDQVVGVDVSEGMLAEARRVCEQRGLGNVTLAVSDDTLSQVEGTFDLIHSAIVFQHIDMPRGRDLFRQLLQRLSPEGVAALHVTYAKAIHADNWGQPPATGSDVSSNSLRPRGLRSILPFSPEAGASASSRADPSTAVDPEMQMNTYNLNELLFMVQQVGVRNLYLEFTDHGGEMGVFLYFQRP